MVTFDGFTGPYAERIEIAKNRFSLRTEIYVSVAPGIRMHMDLEAVAKYQPHCLTDAEAMVQLAEAEWARCQAEAKKRTDVSN